MTSTDELERLIEAGTPGPWRQPFPVNAGSVVQMGMEGGFDLRDCPAPEANAALIVAAVNALPELVERVKRLEGVLRELYDASCSVIDALDDSPIVNEDEAEKFEDALHEARAALNQEQTHESD